jgi:feruloyl esterase
LSEQFANLARIQQALRRPGAMIPAAKLPAIQAAARAGRTPPQCRGRDTGDCLTAPQLAALAVIAKDFDPRYAATPGGWDAWIVNPDPAAQTQLTFAEQFFRHMVLDDPNWRVEDLSAADLRRAQALSPILDATDPDLSRFRRRGGKLLIYAGEADPVISPRAAVDYYRSVGEPDFARLFLIPGMLHCQGGPVPAAFGQAPVAPALRPDAQHDIRLALEDWVEAGRPPDSLVAVRYVRDDPAQGVAATARICPVPAAGRACAPVD